MECLMDSSFSFKWMKSFKRVGFYKAAIVNYLTILKIFAAKTHDLKLSYSEDAISQPEDIRKNQTW